MKRNFQTLFRFWKEKRSRGKYFRVLERNKNGHTLTMIIDMNFIN